MILTKRDLCSRSRFVLLPNVRILSSGHLPTKVVIVVELTCPAEENILSAQIRKLGRYEELVELIKSSSGGGWQVHLRTIEAGSRGFVAHSMRKLFRELGFSNSAAKRACKQVSLVTSRCSYGIWLMRNSKSWNASRQLVVPLLWMPASFMEYLNKMDSEPVHSKAPRKSMSSVRKEASSFLANLDVP